MPVISRRAMLASTAAVGAGLALGGLPLTAQRASAQSSSPLTNIKHVVILMQENRSFDHYFGVQQGVRGFGDQATILLPGGYSVFNQPNGSSRQYPWWMSATSSADGATGAELAQCDGSLDHSWSTQHEAWDNGKMDDWISAKGSVRTMGYLTSADIPFHYALANEWLLCDAYHCSILSATGPNRTYLWSGTIEPSGADGGPAYDGGSESGLSWQTYAENLQNAGVSWYLYQNADDNYSDNGLAFFSQFADASTSSPLYINGMSSVPSTGNTPVDIANAIQDDVVNGTLPQVSWIVANQDTSEHPYAAPANGAYFINLVLNALNADEDVFNSTLVIINYDENDGFFDHVPPPSPPAGTAAEFTQGAAIGLGFRVPCFLISPWTRGGWVDSHVYDHTSVIMFLEQWTTALGSPALCPNISAWRRQTCGNFTGAFQWDNPVYGLPSLPAATQQYSLSYCAPLPDPDPTTNALPVQASGYRSAVGLPYQPNSYVSSLAKSGSNYALTVYLGNEGQYATGGIAMAVYANNYQTFTPVQFALPAYSTSAGNATATEAVTVSGTGSNAGKYDLTVTGPNRFLRRFTGNASTASISTDVTVTYGTSPVTGDLAIFFSLNNAYSSAVTFTITSNNYFRGGPWTYSVPANSKSSQYFEAVADQNGWYDFTITVSVDSSWSRRFTGHIEAGGVSITGSGSATATQDTVTVTSPGSQTATAGTAISPLQISASDSASGQTLTYSATGLPAGLSIGSSTGQITGTPTTAASGSVTVTATDTTGASGSATFTWTVNAASGSSPVVSGGTYNIVLQGGQVIDDPASSTTAGTQLIVYSLNSPATANQQWKFTQNSNGTYTITNVHSGLCMDDSGSSDSAGSEIIQYTGTGNPNQQWSIVANGAAYELVSKQSGLSVTSSGTADLSTLTQQASTSSPLQLWTFTQIS